MNREQRADRGRGNKVRDISAMSRDTTYCSKQISATAQGDSEHDTEKIACGRSGVPPFTIEERHLRLLKAEMSQLKLNANAKT